MAQDQLNLFEERAERLSKEELENWTEFSSQDIAILKKLKGPGVKLLIGPRGSGKSTLFRKAYFDLIPIDGIVPIYVNYSHSLALEPLFHVHANALQLFRQWVLQKILLGLKETFSISDNDAPSTLLEHFRVAEQIITSLEKGEIPEKSSGFIAPSELVKILEEQADHFNASRLVLLLDDAAHAFSMEQQKEFFEIFRQIRTRRVSPKAAIYPGITNYSHAFNVGHEAELLEAWYRPNAPDYLQFMRSIATKRLPAVVIQRFGQNFNDYIDSMALAAYGQPRGFLVMLSQAIGSIDKKNAISRTAVLRSIEDYSKYVRGVFRSLANKLPRYRPFVEAGQKIEREITKGIGSYNLNKTTNKKAVTIGIQEPIPQKIERILKFFEYAGIIRSESTHSRGNKGVYQRYTVNYSILVSDNALRLGQTYKVGDLVTALKSPDGHAYYRVSPTSLVPSNFDAICTLDLPSCSRCNAARLSEDQKFCANCGAELSDASVYRELLRTPISQLPLTPAKITGILEHTRLKTVQDILLDHDHTIKNVPYIDKVWSRRIRNIAEEFVSV